MKRKQFIHLLYLVAIIMFQLEIFGQNIFWIKDHLTIMRNAAITLLVVVAIVKLLRSKMSTKKLLGLLGVCIVGLISMLILGDFAMVCVPLIIIANLDENRKGILRDDLIAKSIVTLIVVLCYCLGATGKTEFIRGEQIRNTMGFMHPNSFGFIVLSLFIETVYLYISIENTKKILLLSMLSLVILEISASRSAEFAIVIIVVLFMICKKKKEIIGRKKLIYLFTVVIMAVPFALTMAYHSLPAAENIDLLTSGRIKWQSYYMENYKINIMGNKIITTGKPLDNAYYRALYNYGIIGLFTCVTLYVLGIRRSINERDYELLIILLSIIAYGTMEWMVIWAAATPIMTIGMNGGKNEK